MLKVISAEYEGRETFFIGNQTPAGYIMSALYRIGDDGIPIWISRIEFAWNTFRREEAEKVLADLNALQAPYKV